MEVAETMPPTATILTSPEGIKVVIFGSTHVSFTSVEEAQRVVATFTPRVVFLELCNQRKQLLQAPIQREPVEELTAAAFLQEVSQRGIIGGVNLALATYMASLGDHLGIDFTPGAEFIGAYQEAANHFNVVPQPDAGAGMIQLGDRDIHVTLKRALRALTVWDKVKLAWTFMSDSIESVTAEDLESLKNSDVVTELFLELGQEQPRLLEPLLFERDRYMRYRLRQTCTRLAKFLDTDTGQRATEAWGEGSGTVVAVVGLGHMRGIVERWDDEVDLEDMHRISHVPPEPWGDCLARYTIYAVGVATIVGMGYATYRGVRWVAFSPPGTSLPVPTVSTATH